jgi:hypothetical protein
VHYAVTDGVGSSRHGLLGEPRVGGSAAGGAGSGCSVRTVRRNQRRFEEHGLLGLGRGRGFPAGRSRSDHSRRRAVQELKTQGHSQREIDDVWGSARRPCGRSFAGWAGRHLRSVVNHLSLAIAPWPRTSASLLRPQRIRPASRLRTQNCPLFP